MLFRTSLAALALSGAALAQSFNVDVGSPTAGFGVPSATYGAAAAQPGTWNARSATVASAVLNDLTGAASTVTLARTGTNLFDFSFNNAGTSGDDQALLDDAQDVGPPGGTTTWTFSNLQAGVYALYTYAFAPDNATYVSDVSGGSLDPLQMVSGAWTGVFVQGVEYARHRYIVAAGGSISVTVATSPSGPASGNFGTLNGFQLVRHGDTPVTSYCDGTVTACPCGNNGVPGNGCANSVNANGANIAGSGLTSIATDTFVLSGSGMLSSSVLYFQGTTQPGGGLGAPFGDGLRCAGGSIRRLGLKTNVGGGSQYPVAGDMTVSVRGGCVVGDVRNYQAWYRNADPTFCTAATFNLTNGIQATWVP